MSRSRKESEYISLYEDIATEQQRIYACSGQETYINPATYKEAMIDRFEILKKIIGSNNKMDILDVGCGTGPHHELSLQHNLYGVDISKTQQKIAIKKGYIILGDTIDDLILFDLRFDIILLVDVLEHLPNPDMMIEQIYNLLKPGGHLIVQVPYKEDLSMYLSPDYPFNYVHLWTFDEHLLEILLTRRNEFVLDHFKFTAYIGGKIRFLKKRDSVIHKIFSKTLITLFKLVPSLELKISKLLNSPIEIIMVVKKV